MIEKIKWHNEKALIKDLIPCSKNPRRLTDKQYKDLKTSLEKFDLAEVPAVNLDNRIIAGHQRLRIMSDLYGKDYEVDIRKPNRMLNDKEYEEYLIRSNKNTGEWGFDILNEEFEIDDLLLQGFTPDDLNIKPLDDVIEDDSDDGDSNGSKSFELTAIFPNETEMLNVYNDLSAKGYLVKIKK